MEITTLKERLSNIVLKEPKPFVSKREVNWPVLVKVGSASVVVLVILLLLMPSPQVEDKNFHEKADPGTIAKGSGSDNDSSLDSLASLNRQNGMSRGGSFDYLSQPSSYQTSLTSGGSRERNAAMIISRSGLDAKNQLPPGGRIPVKLLQKAIVANQAMPVIAVVTSDVIQEDSVAIPEGSRLLGEMSFDDSSDRAQVSWKSVQFSDGRERQLSGIGVSLDGQVGVGGKIHSHGFKNTAGLLITKFIGAYAEGSMQKGAFGSSPGGHENGIKGAFADTAKDRGEAWAEDMKKQKRWIEVGTDQAFLAVINQPFTFRDPGSTYGQ